MGRGCNVGLYILPFLALGFDLDLAGVLGFGLDLEPFDMPLDLEHPIASYLDLEEREAAIDMALDISE